jgi:hypothetical protein
VRPLYVRSESPHWTAPVARWAIWEPVRSEGPGATPDVGFIEPMLRRRLSSLARMSLRVAQDCAHDKNDVRLVYASEHGELVRTTSMLQDLAAGEALSPTAFSLSVLNATAGIFSILQGSTAPTTAVSAAAESFGYGLLEACLQLASAPDVPVLLVYADEPAPEIYGLVEDGERSRHAVAILLESGAALNIDCCRTGADMPRSSGSQSRAFLRSLATGSSSWYADGTAWHWSRR